MAILNRYIYNEKDYWRLINALRQVNQYRYGCLLEEQPDTLFRNAKIFPVQEGFVLLAREPNERFPQLQDLQKPLYLLPFFIVWNEKNQRLRLQLNRDFIRLKIWIIDEASRHEYRWVDKDSVKIKQAEFIGFCNTITQEIQEAGRYCWVEPQTLAAYDRQVKKIVLRWLTTVARVPVAQAKQIHAQYVRRWWRGVASREKFLARTVDVKKTTQALDLVLG